jgi:predicted enzyme related to lactoylglutathione lyase
METSGIKTILYPVRDAARAKELFTALAGAAPMVDQPYYVGWRIGEQDVGLVPGGHEQGMTAPLAYCHVEDLDAARRGATGAGATVVQPKKEVGGGRTIASVRDADGNLIGLLQP